mmetsp:Transcript_9805/g.23582  ORF Transcript_9805/g.23582 Transcript_9805/m.23582 type:complete len:526 (-) Transcript_9805:94-1671(-)
MGLCGGNLSAQRHDAEASDPKPPTRESESTDVPDDGSASDQSDDDDGGTKSRWVDVSTEFSSRTNNLILHSTSGIKRFYNLSSEKLGEGGFGFVMEAKNLVTGNKYAVKRVSKARAKQKRLEVRSEIDIMKLFDHPNVVKLHETFEDRLHIYLVMELCAGGDLDKHMKDQARPYSEQEAAFLMEQILKSVAYLHDCKGICHRDLKLGNFLFLRKAPVENNVLKLADFGLACGFQPGQVLATKVGTVAYCSPQVLSGVYEHSADLWSCGVIMYMLLANEPPFPGKNDAEVAQRVRKANYVFNDGSWFSVSEEAKDLVRKLLKYQPFDRATADEARAHSWFRLATPYLRHLTAPAEPSVVRDLVRFMKKGTFQRAVLRAVAMQLSQDAVEQSLQQFSALDTKGMSLLTVQDVEDLMETPAMEPLLYDLRQAVEILCSRPAAENSISFNDFMAATLRPDQCKEPTIRAAFRIFDQDADGCISTYDVEQVFCRSEDTNAEVVSAILAEVGTSPVRYEDFSRFFLRTLRA